MANLKSDLAAVIKTLKQLTKKTESLAKKVDKPAKRKAARKPKAKKAAKAKAKRRVVAKKRVVAKRRVAPKKKVVARRPAKQSASEVILSIMKKSRGKKGVATALIQKKTGFNNQKIRDNIYKLTKRGKIQRVGRGVYSVK